MELQLLLPPPGAAAPRLQGSAPLSGCRAVVAEVLAPAKLRGKESIGLALSAPPALQAVISWCCHHPQPSSLLEASARPPCLSAFQENEN